MKIKPLFKILSFLMIAVLFIFSACKDEDQSEANTGGISVQIIWPSNNDNRSDSLTAPLYATMPDTVVTVKFLVSASDMTTQEKPFVASAGKGTIDGIPVGNNRTLTIQGLDKQNVVLYEGEEKGISISKGVDEPIGTVTMDIYTGEYTWQFIDGGGDVGINSDASGGDWPKIGVSFGSVHISWREKHVASIDSSYDVLRVKQWNGSDTWDFIDGGSSKGINKILASSVDDSKSHNMFGTGTSLYAIWSEEFFDASDNKYTSTRVAEQKSGGSWKYISGDTSTDSISKSTNKNSRDPLLITYQSTLFAAWGERNSDSEQLRVAKFDDNNKTWDFVDGNHATQGINYDLSSDIDNPTFATFNDKLYLAWADGDTQRIRVAEWNGIDTWRFVDGNEPNGLNRNPLNRAESVDLLSFNDKLYATWNENNDGIFHVFFVEWNGDQSWSYLDNGAEAGLNRNPLVLAGLPKLAVNGKRLYMVWVELFGTKLQLRASRWEGGTTWTSIDGDGDTGLNKNSALNAFGHDILSYNNELYITWQEAPNREGPGIIRVAKWGP